MVTAFKEFSGITQESISDQRAKHKDAVLDNIESFAKRTSIRNLGPDSKRLSMDDLGFLYDRFYGILYEREQRMQVLREESDLRAKAAKAKANEIATGIPGNTSIEIGRVGLGPSPTQMNYDAFREFLAGITKWAVTDTPTNIRKDSVSETSSIYSGHSGRSRSFSLSPWGSGSEPADHDFMQRLYGKWNREDRDGLCLQDVVSGLAQVKGTRDLMSTISYFFDLYDDDSDGKVDREGILRISEALLFLTRRGLGGTITPSPSSTNLSPGGDSDPSGGNVDEIFLSSVSAFIRRCFEYADPDHPQNQSDGTAISEGQLSDGINNFSIGDDEDEDLLDTGSDAIAKSPTTPTPSSLKFTTQSSQPRLNPTSRKASANLALDPANPLHITLPTFRMVILADELLQGFFESTLPNSFHLSASPSVSRTPTLSTFSAPNGGSSHLSLPTVGQSGGVVSPNKGLRGVLDNIVSDGMRVASEVKKRMDEAQREIEKNATTAHRQDDEDDDDRGNEGYGEETDRRSVRETDRDLLDGAEADAGAGSKGQMGEDELLILGEPGSPSSTKTTQEKLVEFEQ